MVRLFPLYLIPKANYCFFFNLVRLQIFCLLTSKTRSLDIWRCCLKGRESSSTTASSASSSWRWRRTTSCAKSKMAARSAPGCFYCYYCIWNFFWIKLHTRSLECGEICRSLTFFILYLNSWGYPALLVRTKKHKNLNVVIWGGSCSRVCA